MKLKFLIDKFSKATKAIFGEARRQTKAALQRLETPIVAKGESFAGAMTGMLTRQIRHNMLMSYRKNTRGLPVGISVHQVRAARALKNRLGRPDDDETVISESRINAADTVLEQVKNNAKTRAQYPRRSKLARRISRDKYSLRPAVVSDATEPPTLVQPSGLQLWCARHTQKLRNNKKQGRVPYTRPVSLAL